MDTASIVSRFVSIKPVIQEILSISGAVGLSYGILHQGQVVHTESFGYRDHEQKLPVDSQTMFPICSMTKGLVSSALGLLVQKGKLSWETPIHELLPWFSPQSDVLTQNATLLDFLAMRSGLERYNNWSQSYNRINFAQSQSQKVLNSLQMSSGLRWKFSYNNWAYEIASHVCKEIGGESWDSMLHANFFNPLGLKRTDATGNREGFDNVAKAYMVLDNLTPVAIPKTPLSGQTLMGAAGGVESCVDDMLVLYHSILKAACDQFGYRKSDTPNNTFQSLADTFSGYTSFPGDSLYESSYGMGWIRTQLPNQMCKISPNNDLLGEQPVIGKGAASRLVIAHYGSMPGTFAGVNLFPETESAIVVLTNTTPLCDLTDYMTQLLTQTLFDFPEKVDLVSWVKRTAEAELRWHARITADMKRERVLAPPAHALGSYVGTYVNKAETFFMEIAQQEDKLLLLFEGRQDELFPLEHLNDDTFSWLQSRNDLVSRGRVVLQPATYYMLRFEAGTNGEVDRLFWAHDSELPRGEEYIKKKEGQLEIEKLIHGEL